MVSVLSQTDNKEYNLSVPLESLTSKKKLVLWPVPGSAYSKADQCLLKGHAE